MAYLKRGKSLTKQGIGVAPYKWGDSYVALDVGKQGSIAGHASSDAVVISENAYTDGTWRYKQDDEAALLEINDGAFGFKTKGSGSADASITWDTAMTIANDKSIEIPTDSARFKFTGTGGTASIYADGTLAIGTTGGTDSFLYFSGDQVSPVAAHGGGWRDNAIDLGNSSSRFDDIYATNGTIQTSDEREKNTITTSDLGLDFVNALSPKSYIFNDKTRTHYGLIAQDVETVLSEIGKSTQEFAGFIKTPLEEIDGTKTDDVRYGLRMAEFITPMIKAIQELSAKVTALENA